MNEKQIKDFKKAFKKTRKALSEFSKALSKIKDEIINKIPKVDGIVKDELDGKVVSTDLLGEDNNIKPFVFPSDTLIKAIKDCQKHNKIVNYKVR